MKKIILIAGLTVLALAVLGVGVAFAQDGTPPYYGGMMGNGGFGPMHDYVEQALADKLGLTVNEVEDQFAAGKSMYQIALDAGIAEADIPTLLQEVHTTAFNKAVADGVLTQEQADFMLQHMAQFGYNPGNCPMYNGAYGPGTNGAVNGTGYGFGRGMMGRGWGWQNQ